MNDIDDERIRQIVREELTTFSPPKKKRAPNKWQVFLKGCVKEQDTGLAYTEKVKKCSVEYKASKNGNSNNPSPEISDINDSDIDRLTKLSNKKLAQMAK
jgi:hypothetical protein